MHKDSKVKFEDIEIDKVYKWTDLLSYQNPGVIEYFVVRIKKFEDYRGPSDSYYTCKCILSSDVKLYPIGGTMYIHNEGSYLLEEIDL